MEFAHVEVCIWSYVKLYSISVSVVRIVKYHFKCLILYKLSGISGMLISTYFQKTIFHDLYVFRQLCKSNLSDINVEDFPKILCFFNDCLETLTDISKESVP